MPTHLDVIIAPNRQEGDRYRRALALAGIHIKARNVVFSNSSAVLMGLQPRMVYVTPGTNLKGAAHQVAVRALVARGSDLRSAVVYLEPAVV
jgi:hypothetical protein